MINFASSKKRKYPVASIPSTIAVISSFQKQIIPQVERSAHNHENET